ncbi:hypothetical protein NPIL_175451 [Nephila pilipes]|uniref:Uncharacterized protein n=1 Tax=Nephila pilipes TaxID=299642 RepID=A0A8X6QHN7_NEPPI|nr:hypothetical protein NPIL_175451 [Nephila pilipes]
MPISLQKSFSFLSLLPPADDIHCLERRTSNNPRHSLLLFVEKSQHILSSHEPTQPDPVVRDRLVRPRQRRPIQAEEGLPQRSSFYRTRLRKENAAIR